MLVKYRSIPNAHIRDAPPLAPSQAELQLELDEDEIQTGAAVGATAWLASGLKIQEDQSVLPRHSNDRLYI